MFLGTVVRGGPTYIKAVDPTGGPRLGTLVDRAEGPHLTPEANHILPSNLLMGTPVW